MIKNLSRFCESVELFQFYSVVIQDKVFQTSQDNIDKGNSSSNLESGTEFKLFPPPSFEFVNSFSHGVCHQNALNSNINIPNMFLANIQMLVTQGGRKQIFYGGQ